MSAEKTNLYELGPQALASLLAEWGEPAYRAKQMYRHLYVNLVRDAADMTDLPKALRARLGQEACIGDLVPVHVQEGDAGFTRKALWRLPTGESIESVLMVYPGRSTVCVSSQAGCPMGCVFCATAKLGFLRDLTPGQIVEQVLWGARETRLLAAQSAAEEEGRSGYVPPEERPRDLSNVVFMGMGEAFNNYDAWWAAVERLHDPAGFNMGARSFTVSTVGLVPGILRLAKERLPINLAISLHAPDDALRSELMPVNKAYPIRPLLEATRAYAEETHRRVSFEYVLLQGKNDRPEQAAALVRLLREGPLGDRIQWTHVNLIPWNPVPGTPLERSHRRQVQAFQRILQDGGIPCTVRMERGTEIAAACGQLAGAQAAAASPTT